MMCYTKIIILLRLDIGMFRNQKGKNSNRGRERD